LMSSEGTLLAAYWLTSVGIGPVDPPPEGVLPGKQTVKVPVSEVLRYKRSDGSPQVNILLLTGANFTKSSTFEAPYLDIEEELLSALSDSSTIKALQAAGTKVVLSIMGGHGEYGWQSIPEEKIADFVNYLKLQFLEGYGLDGIDIDDEYYSGNKSTDILVETVKQMRNSFPPSAILSKALFRDFDILPKISSDLNYGGIMYYGNDAGYLQSCYRKYRECGLKNSQLLIGVNAGPAVEQPAGNFTSLEVTEALAQWEPEGGQKAGMMLWSFSQDIQQFTTDPQNQIALQYPNIEDHLWQRKIIEVMEGKRSVVESSSSHHLRGSEEK